MLDSATQPEGVSSRETISSTTPIRVEANQFRQIVERIERIKAERADLADVEKQAFAEAQSLGYMIRPLKRFIKERARDPDDIAEEDACLEMFREAMR